MLPYKTTVIIFITQLFYILSILQLTNGDIAVSKKCGIKNCELNQYCDSHSSRCADCEPICEESNHNFDSLICVSNCQDYLHNSRFAKQSEIDDLRQTVNTLIIIVIVLKVLFITVHGFHFVRWCKHKGYLKFGFLKKLNIKKNNKDKKTDAKLPYTVENQYTQSPKGTRRMPTESVFSVTADDSICQTVHTCSTPVSGRHPAEDSTENYSYDNAGLAVTPTAESMPKNETNF